MEHLRYSGKTHVEQRAALEKILRDNDVVMTVLRGLRELDLHDWMLVAGAIYNGVWNVLTEQPVLNGVKDIDVFYFDDTDLSYEAEDAVIQRANRKFADLPLPVEVRNQARVHLWFPQKFKQPFSPLTSSAESLLRYASKTHAVGVHLDHNDKMTIHAPFGLDLIFSFRVVPNHVLENRVAHEEKGTRAKKSWPQLSVEPW